MGTRGPVLVESGGEFPFVPLLIMIAIGIIGISAWLSWMYFKSRNKSTAVIRTPVLTQPTHADPDFLSLRRSLTEGWEIYVNGQRYRNLEAVPEEAVRRDVVKGIKALANFARKHLQKEQSASQARASQPRVAQTPASAVAPPDRSAWISSPPKSSAPAPPSPKPAPSPPTTTASLRFRLAEPALKRSYTPAKFMPTIDLAQEIGEIVDTLLPVIPALQNRSIRLRNAASGGIEFTIDGIVYADIHEIPDAEVQALIQAAIQEWERRK